MLTALGGVAVWQDLPKYGGTYTVTPEVGAGQTLETAGKYLTNDVTVNAIPDYEVTNEAGHLLLVRRFKTWLTKRLTK